MIATAAIAILAVYSNSSVPPSTGLLPPMTIQQSEAQRRATQQPASPQQQSTHSGVVEDKNNSRPIDTGLLPDPEAGNRVVVPRLAPRQ